MHIRALAAGLALQKQPHCCVMSIAAYVGFDLVVQSIVNGNVPTWVCHREKVHSS